MMDSGQIIRKLRDERFLKLSDIERLSRSIADSKGNDQYYIAHATQLEIEAGSVPSIYKLDSLAMIFKIPLPQILTVFGINVRESEEQTLAPKETTLQPTDLIERDVSFRLNFDNRLDPRETNLLLGKPEELGILPTALTRRLQPGRFTYAIVGLEDDSMGELIPPGSLIEVDKEQNTVPGPVWRTLRERPIFLVWHDDGYGFGWCQQSGGELLLIPHPASKRLVRRLKPRDIIGRVVHAWCSLQAPPVPC